ncbi:unnamed protein product [Lactuca virosa]|uniref:Uncharacterized protein n=1 Tax=Lactuca virosa TaxID=75947 RepID=A0AAU9N1G0_9ASTR|nr:unnamed protein product [Lactuca virosa]
MNTITNPTTLFHPQITTSHRHLRHPLPPIKATFSGEETQTHHRRFIITTSISLLALNNLNVQWLESGRRGRDCTALGTCWRLCRGVPEPRKSSYVKAANELVNNMSEFDTYIRSPKVYESYLYYEKTLKSIDNLVAILA